MTIRKFVFLRKLVVPDLRQGNVAYTHRRCFPTYRGEKIIPMDLDCHYQEASMIYFCRLSLVSKSKLLIILD
jgi:hypothetical protein